MNRFSRAPRDKLKFGGNLSYFSSCLIDNLAMTNFLHYPLTFNWAKLLILDMFSKVPRGQIKKVTSFTLWFDLHSYGFALFLHGT